MFCRRRKTTMSRRQKRELLENKDYVQNYAKGRKVCNNINNNLTRHKNMTFFPYMIYGWSLIGSLCFPSLPCSAPHQMGFSISLIGEA